MVLSIIYADYRQYWLLIIRNSIYIAKKRRFGQTKSFLMILIFKFLAQQSAYE